MPPDGLARYNNSWRFVRRRRWARLSALAQAPALTRWTPVRSEGMRSQSRRLPGRIPISLAIPLVLVSAVSAAARRPDALDRSPGVQLDVGGVVGERVQAVTQNW